MRLDISRQSARAKQLSRCSHGHGHVLRSEPGAPAPRILDLERELVSDRYEFFATARAARPQASSAGPCASSTRRRATSSRSCRRRSTSRRPARPGWSGCRACSGRWPPRPASSPGAEAVITRLGDILVIQAIRAWIENDPAAQRGWLELSRTPRSAAPSHRFIATPLGTGPSPPWPTSWRCRARRSPPASPRSSASR